MGTRFSGGMLLPEPRPDLPGFLMGSPGRPMSSLVSLVALAEKIEESHMAPACQAQPLWVAATLNDHVESLLIDCVMKLLTPTGASGDSAVFFDQSEGSRIGHLVQVRSTTGHTDPYILW